MGILKVLAGTSLVIAGIALLMWFLEEFADDNDFQGHPQGAPFSETQQAAYQQYQIA